VRRIRLGEALLGTGAIALFVLLFADWFKGGGVSASGWSSIGWVLDILFVVVILLALTTVALTAVGAKPAIALGPGVITVTVAVITLPIALVRVLITQPALDIGLGNEAVKVQVAGYLGLVALIMIVVGAWITIADERTDAPDSAYTPPPPRAVPGS
jgi:fucose 4-O-acetylase-like acetyltransferase